MQTQEQLQEHDKRTANGDRQQYGDGSVGSGFDRNRGRQRNPVRTNEHVCPLSATIAVGGSCTMNVTFRPTGAGNRASTLRVAASAPATTQNVAWTGTGL